MRYDESESGDRRGLPLTEFLYTIDQVAHVMRMPIASLRTLIYFEGLIGRKQRYVPTKMMKAVNLIPSEMHDEPEWRVPESELVKYLENAGLVVYERRLQK